MIVDGFMFTANEIYPWSSVTQIVRRPTLYSSPTYNNTLQVLQRTVIGPRTPKAGPENMNPLKSEWE